MKKVTASSQRGSKWNVWQNDNGTWDSREVHTILLQDIRDNLQDINAVLRAIQRNTTKKKRVRK